jgi:hypothetical protein
VQSSLNLRAREALLGLAYRALAGEAAPDNAALTQRRIELLQASETEILARCSALRTDTRLAKERSQTARRGAESAALDLRLFDEQHPPPPRRRGLLSAPRLSPAQQEFQRKRAELEAVVGQATSRADEEAANAGAIAHRLNEAESELEQVRDQRSAYAGQLRDELAGRVLGQLAAGQTAEAGETLASVRRVMRGDLMVGVLLVLSALLTQGGTKALETLAELKTIFSQHTDPVGRVLEGLVAWHGGGAVSQQGPGLFTGDHFSVHAHFRFYRLVRVLSGLPAEEHPLGTGTFGPTLWITQEYMRRGGPVEDRPYTLLQLSSWAARQDVVVRVIAVQMLLEWGETRLVLGAAGINPAELRPPRRRSERWPTLRDLLAAQALTSWPAALTPLWIAALACQVLRGAQGHVPEELFEAWVAESYDWPKSDHYWWTLSQAKDDPALLGKVTGAEDELFAVA